MSAASGRALAAQGAAAAALNGKVTQQLLNMASRADACAVMLVCMFVGDHAAIWCNTAVHTMQSAGMVVPKDTFCCTLPFRLCDATAGDNVAARWTGYAGPRYACHLSGSP